MPALKEENLAGNRADLLCQRGVLEKLAILAVHGDEIFRPHELQKNLHLFLAGVAGNVNGSVTAAFVVNEHAPAEEVVNHAKNGLFVAGNDARGKDDRIVLGDAHQAVIVHGDARESGHGFGLGAAGEHDEFFGVEAADILRPDDAAVRNTQFTEAVRYLNVVHHAAPDETDFTSHAARDVDHLLD